LGLRGYALTGPPRVHCRYGPTTRTHPPGEVVEGLQDRQFPSGPALRATGLPILTPAGLTPAGHISLSWTHNRACTFQCTRLKQLTRSTRLPWPSSCHVLPDGSTDGQDGCFPVCTLLPRYQE